MDLVGIAHAMGQAGGQAGGQTANPLVSFFPLILMFVIFYFLLIRPQQKKAKEHREMLASLRKGDRVLTTGGLYGRIVDMDGDVLTLEVADKIQIKVNRGYIAGLVSPENKAKQEDKKTGKKEK